ncbi:MAG: CotH kinase family protein [Saprospiraceae bacterium]|nr:CotH kinase family protein [Saprospiraceae bacterium]
MDKYGPPPGQVGGDWRSSYPPTPGAWQETWFQYRDPKTDEISPEQASYIQNYIGGFENMLQSDKFADEYLSWIDLDSWVDYLLVQELCKNSDAYRLSAYFYKQKDSDGGKIFMGPEWDFNIAFGLGDYCEGDLWTGWVKDYNEVCPNDTWLIHFWWERLWGEEKFRQRVVERWQEHRISKWSDEKLFGIIDSLINVLELPQERNFDRWPVFGKYVWPNAFVGDSYEEEISYLRNWFVNRLQWLDAEIPLLTLASFELEKDNKVQIFPNPTSQQIYLRLPDSAGEKWVFEIYNLSGQSLFRKSLDREADAFPIELKSHDLAPGFYLLHLIGENGYHTAEKFRIE